MHRPSPGGKPYTSHVGVWRPFFRIVCRHKQNIELVRHRSRDDYTVKDICAFLRCLTTTLEGHTSIGHHFLYCGHVQTDHLAVRQSQASMQIIQQKRISQGPGQKNGPYQSDETKLSREPPTDAYKD